MRGITIIGVMGAKGSGKSELSKHLTSKHGFIRIRFADALKDMLKNLGLTEAQVDGDQKEEPLPFLCGKTPRWAMQSLGTEWGRNLIGQDIWVHATQQKILSLSMGRKSRVIIIDDMRFPNEVAMIREMGGMVWRVRRPEVEPEEPHWVWRKLYDWGLWKRPDLHPSERYWRTIEPDFEITNTGTLEELFAKADLVAEKCKVCK